MTWFIFFSFLVISSAKHCPARLKFHSNGTLDKPESYQIMVFEPKLNMKPVNLNRRSVGHLALHLPESVQQQVSMTQMVFD